MEHPVFRTPTESTGRPVLVRIVNAIVVILLILAVAAVVAATVGGVDLDSLIPGFDPESAVPTDSQLPLPWLTMNGLWGILCFITVLVVYVVLVRMDESRAQLMEYDDAEFPETLSEDRGSLKTVPPEILQRFRNHLKPEADETLVWADRPIYSRVLALYTVLGALATLAIGPGVSAFFFFSTFDPFRITWPVMMLGNLIAVVMYMIRLRPKMRVYYALSTHRAFILEGGYSNKDWDISAHLFRKMPALTLKMDARGRGSIYYAQYTTINLQTHRIGFTSVRHVKEIEFTINRYREGKGTPDPLDKNAAVMVRRRGSLDSDNERLSRWQRRPTAAPLEGEEMRMEGERAGASGLSRRLFRGVSMAAKPSVSKPVDAPSGQSKHTALLEEDRAGVSRGQSFFVKASDKARMQAKAGFLPGEDGDVEEMIDMTRGRLEDFSEDSADDGSDNESAMTSKRSKASSVAGSEAAPAPEPTKRKAKALGLADMLPGGATAVTGAPQRVPETASLNTSDNMDATPARQARVADASMRAVAPRDGLGDTDDSAKRPPGVVSLIASAVQVPGMDAGPVTKPADNEPMPSETATINSAISFNGSETSQETARSAASASVVSQQKRIVAQPPARVVAQPPAHVVAQPPASTPVLPPKPSSKKSTPRSSISRTSSKGKVRSRQVSKVSSKSLQKAKERNDPGEVSALMDMHAELDNLSDYLKELDKDVDV